MIIPVLIDITVSAKQNNNIQIVATEELSA